MVLTKMENLKLRLYSIASSALGDFGDSKTEVSYYFLCTQMKMENLLRESANDLGVSIMPKFHGKSTLACFLSRELHSRGKLSYVLDGDNLRHGLNKDLGFKPEDRAENIRRTDIRVLSVV